MAAYSEIESRITKNNGIEFLFTGRDFKTFVPILAQIQTRDLECDELFIYWINDKAFSNFDIDEANTQKDGTYPSHQREMMNFMIDLLTNRHLLKLKRFGTNIRFWDCKFININDKDFFEFFNKWMIAFIDSHSELEEIIVPHHEFVAFKRASRLCFNTRNQRYVIFREYDKDHMDLSNEFEIKCHNIDFVCHQTGEMIQAIQNRIKKRVEIEIVPRKKFNLILISPKAYERVMSSFFKDKRYMIENYRKRYSAGNHIVWEIVITIKYNDSDYLNEIFKWKKLGIIEKISYREPHQNRFLHPLHCEAVETILSNSKRGFFIVTLHFFGDKDIPDRHPLINTFPFDGFDIIGKRCLSKTIQTTKWEIVLRCRFLDLPMTLTNFEYSENLFFMSVRLSNADEIFKSFLSDD